MSKKYGKKRNKKYAVASVALALMLLCATVAGLYKSNILAGVFKMTRNADNTISYTEVKNITILEIVAQDGQQVLGYTVEGSEPITKEKIEEYSGDIDPTEFENATGYQITGSAGNWTVTGNTRNKTFLDNVLDQYMYQDGDSVTVKTVLASNLTEDDLTGVDLIYINSADYDPNLLYYYDQIMNDGKAGVAKGDYGYSYADSYTTESTVQEIAIETIQKAAGRPSVAMTLTDSVFQMADVENYNDRFLVEYISGIGELEKNSLDAESLDEAVAKISGALATINQSVATNAKNRIVGFVDQGSVSDEERVLFINSLSTYDGFSEVNENEYVDYIIENAFRTKKKIAKAVTSINSANFNSSLETLLAISNGTYEGNLDEEGNPIPDFDYLPVVMSAIEKVYGISSDYNYVKINKEAYANIFIDSIEDFYSEDINELYDKIGENIITLQNQNERDGSLDLISRMPGHSETISAYTVDDIKNIFEICNFAQYKSYNIEKYIDRLGELEENALRTQVESSSGYVWSYDYDAIERDLLKYVNDAKGESSISCDLGSWSVAMSMYDKVTADGTALVYNTELLTSKVLGWYSIAPGSSNKMYKFLLIIRQMTSDYFNSAIRQNIDAEGTYLGNASWFAGTFCTNYSNENAVDKSKFVQPAVVGKVYNTDGTVSVDAGANGNTYISGNVFTYVPGDSNDGYFGGASFKEEDYKKVITVVESQQQQAQLKNIRIYFCTKDLKDGSRYWWDECFERGDERVAYTYTDVNGNTVTELEGTTQAATSSMCYDDNFKNNNWYNYTSYIDVPETTSQIYLYISRSDWAEFNFTATQYGPLSDGSLIYITNTPTMVAGSFATNKYGKSPKRWAISYVADGKMKKYGNTESSVTLTETGMTKADVLRQIMSISLTQLSSMPFKILEIQPTGGCSDLNNYAAIAKLADSMRVSLPNMDNHNYKDYFKVETISVSEFNTRHELLNGTYDMIYFGLNTGYIKTKTYTTWVGGNKSVTRTYYGDNKTVMGENNCYMNGLVYTGIGPQRDVASTMRGTVKTDYNVSNDGNFAGSNEGKIWTTYFFEQFKSGNNQLSSTTNYVLKSEATTTRLSGNDLTVARMNDLLDYLKAGYPILFADGILDADTDNYIDCTTSASSAHYNTASKWRYVDKKSKMYAFIKAAKSIDPSEFKDGYTYASIVSMSNAKNGKNPKFLAPSETYLGGLGYAIQRSIHVDFEILHAPQEYDRDENRELLSQGSTGRKENVNGSTCYFVLKPKTNVPNVLEWIKANYDFHMYIDKAGDGNFKMNRTVELDLSETYYNTRTNEITVATKNRKWPKGVEGFIPWRIEVVSKTNDGNKWSYTGYSAFDKDKKRVNVLWISAQANGNGAIDGTTLDFSGMISDHAADIQEYDIRVDRIRYSDFVGLWNTDISYDPTAVNANKLVVGNSQIINKLCNRKSITEDNGKDYDMLVFGYCDSYGGLDISNINCLKNIDYFVTPKEEGGLDHSILFAHDNASYITTFNYYTSYRTGLQETYFQRYTGESHFESNFARYTTCYMRGLLGMDMYGASYNSEAFKNIGSYHPDGDFKYLSWLRRPTESIYNARKYIVSDTAISNPSTDELEGMRGYADGLIYRYSIDNDNIVYDNCNIARGQLPVTTKSECTNKGQISMYPYVIGDEITLGTSTHFQYTKLDVEDKDTTVWYTLAGDKNTIYDASKGDGANNYYIYSKGNITYTGAGHRHIDSDAYECKLFVNTVVAALKLGSFAPDVTFTDSVSVTSGGTTEDVLYAYETDSNMKVTFKATDYDVDRDVANNFQDAVIFLDKNNDGIYDNGTDILLNVPTLPISGGTGNSYLKDAAGSSININGTELINRKDTTFYLSYDDLASIYDSRHGLSSLSKAGKVKALFETDKYKIAVAVVNKATNVAGKNGRDRYRLYSRETAKIIVRSLFNLN